jgi:hypothetical protein
LRRMMLPSPIPCMRNHRMKGGAGEQRAALVSLSC